MLRRYHDRGVRLLELIWALSFEGFKKRLMEFYRKGKERPLMEALTGMMAEGIMTLCNRCQSDRLVCALRPLCGDRKYTSLLADMGATEDEIKKTHAFCFSNHVSRLKDIKENKESFNSVRDAKFPLSTFLQVVLSDTRREGSSPQFSMNDLDSKKLLQLLEPSLKGAWGEYTTNYGDSIFLIIGNKNGIIQIDLDRKVACVNPENELIRSDAQFKAVVELLSALYSLNVVIEETVRGLDYLSFPLEVRATGQDKSRISEEAAKLVNKLQGEGVFSTALDTPKGDIKLFVEIKPPRSGLSMNQIGLSYGYLKNLMQQVSRTFNRKPVKE